MAGSFLDVNVEMHFIRNCTNTYIQPFSGMDFVTLGAQHMAQLTARFCQGWWGRLSL